MKRILFVEDEAAFAVGVIDRLESEGYAVEWAQTGPAGYEKALAGGFDLIVLDVMLPGKIGFDVCRDLRREGLNAPVLMLTARGEVIDRVVGLKLGADDYLPKNCEPVELMARIEALLRRSGWRAGHQRWTDRVGRRSHRPAQTRSHARGKAADALAGGVSAVGVPHRAPRPGGHPRGIA